MNVSILFRKFCVTPVVLRCFPLKFWAGDWRAAGKKSIHLGMRTHLTAVLPHGDALKCVPHVSYDYFARFNQ